MLIRDKIDYWGELRTRLYWIMCGVASVIDGITMIFSLGYFSSNLQCKLIMNAPRVSEEEISDAKPLPYKYDLHFDVKDTTELRREYQRLLEDVKYTWEKLVLMRKFAKEDGLTKYLI